MCDRKNIPVAAQAHPVFAFLLGEGPLRGVYFGDRHPDERGAFWWRKDLRAALAQQPSAQAQPPGDADGLTAIYDAFGIGSAARTPGILMANIRNAVRRSRCLSAIERVLTVETSPDPDEGDDEPGEECLLRWGADPEGYAEHFTAALAQFQATQPSVQDREDALTAAARDVLVERQRQIEAEHWTPAHDDAHCNSDLAKAAACYALANEFSSAVCPPMDWPWGFEFWKPGDMRRNRVKAGALILAEIERIDRAAARAAKEDGQP